LIVSSASRQERDKPQQAKEKLLMVALTSETAIPKTGLSVEELLALAPDTDDLPDHLRSPAEAQAINTIRAKQMARAPAPAWFARKSDVTGAYIVAPNHVDQELGEALTMEALGLTSSNVLGAIIDNISNLAVVNGTLDEARFNRLLATVRSVEPADELEAMMAVQMAAIHDATMTHARRLHLAGNAETLERNEKAVNRLARTFAAQMATLKQYRSGGVQKVIVQHVHVNEGGQAVVAGELNGGGHKRER
jgi:hypothetical protein